MSLIIHDKHVGITQKTIRMGIKYFYSWLIKNHSNAISSKCDLKFDKLYIDANCVFHRAAQKFYGYGDYERPPTRLVNVSDDRSTESFARYVCTTMERIIVGVNTKSVYISVDGVAPIAKQNQQKIRRAATEQIIGNGFDPNTITAGTDLVDRICRGLREELHSLRGIVDVTVDGHENPGEGEHKIFSDIRRRTDQSNWKSDAQPRYCVLSIDSDVILLSMLTDDISVVIHRFNEYVDVTAFKQTIELREGVAARDFVAAMALLGNDFLPPQDTLSIRDGGIETLLDALRGVELCDRERGAIDVTRLYVLLRRLSAIESLNPTTVVDVKGCESCKVDECEKYVEGLIWNYRYYAHGLPSWDWHYPYERCPTARDIISNTNAEDLSTVEFQLGHPSSLTEQLERILPARNIDLIPEDRRVEFLRKSIITTY